MPRSPIFCLEMLFLVKRLYALFEKHREVIMYLIFGVATTAVSLVVYAVCERLFLGNAAIESLGNSGLWQLLVGFFGKDLKIAIAISNAVSWVIAVSFAFIVNKMWVFNSKSWRAGLVAKEAAAFVGGRAVTGVLEIVAVPLLVSFGLNQTLLGYEGLFAKILVLIVIMILNYFISKFMAFRPTKTE